jgi:NTE family protein
MPQFKNLVFEGGGVKGIAYSSAIKILQEQGIMPEIRRVAGTSAGAITAALVAFGATDKEIADIVGGTKFREFMDDSWGVIRDMERLINDYGWYKGDAFSGWIQKQVAAFTQDTETTFAELADKAALPNTKFKELFVVGTNLSLQMPAVYSAETTPDFPIWEAIRISMSIPLFFAAIKRNQGKQIFVDGGVTWNYPLDLFDDKKYVSNPKAGVVPGYDTVYDDNHIYNKETLGLRVDTRNEIEAEKDSWRLPPVEINDFFDYAKALVSYMSDMANKLHLHKNDWDRTIFLDAGGVKTTEFDLSDAKVNRLLQNGEQGANDYFRWFNNPNTTPKPLNRL